MLSAAIRCQFTREAPVHKLHARILDLTSQKRLSIDHQEFLVKAELRQTTLSQVALNKSNHEDVRQFARRVITNYHRALAELMDLIRASSQSKEPCG
jgi:hypothetical protein